MDEVDSDGEGDARGVKRSNGPMKWARARAQHTPWVRREPKRARPKQTVAAVARTPAQRNGARPRRNT